MQLAVLQCLHVAGIGAARLAAGGVGDARRTQSLGYSDRFGFYQIAPPAGP